MRDTQTQNNFKAPVESVSRDPHPLPAREGASKKSSWKAPLGYWRERDKRKRFSGAQLAKIRVQRAIKSGKLKSLKNNFILCAHCNVNRAILYEHRDYSKPLDVTPCCQQCNHRLGPAKPRPVGTYGCVVCGAEAYSIVDNKAYCNKHWQYSY